MNMAGMMAKYLATSLAMEKVVSAPRVMSNCFPISMTSISLVGSLSKSTIFPASLAAWVPEFMATPISAEPGRGVVGTVAHHGDEPARPLLLADILELVLRRSLGDVIVDAGLLAMAAAVSGLSPVTMTTRSPWPEDVQIDPGCPV